MTALWWTVVGLALAGPPECPNGQVAVGRAGHCCWPGQSWDRRQEQCAGMPRTCPSGWSVELPEPGSAGAPRCADLSNTGGTARPASPPKTRGPDPIDGDLFETHGAFAPRPQPRPTAEVRASTAVRIGVPVIEGGVDQATLEAALAERAHRIARCFETLRTELPGVAGSVTFSLAVSGAGTVQAVGVVSTELEDAPSQTCVAHQLQAMDLASSRAPGPGRVVLPIHLDDSAQ